MSLSCVVLDFDGTLTDVAREAPPFTAAFPLLLADLLGRDLAGAWPEEERAVRALSPELAWTFAGHAVGPADADPFVRASCVAQRLLDRFRILTADPALRGDVLAAVFRHAYRRTRAAFRPEAAPVLGALLARGLAVHVVTNAAAEAVDDKLAALVASGALSPADRARVRVHGDAGKFVVAPPSRPDARFAGLPAERRLPGLERPLLLGRGRYADALASIWAETGAGPEETLVCGDIFELDLGLPAEVGAHVHLIRRETTYAYELDAVAALGARGAVSGGLDALLARTAP